MADLYKGFQASDFYETIASTVSARKMTWKQVSEETGVSASTLTRMAQGRQPDAASQAALSAWAGINPADFVHRQGKKPKAEALVTALALFRADPKLKPEAKSAFEAIVRATYNEFTKDKKS